MRPSGHELGDSTAGGNPSPRDQHAQDPLKSAADFVCRSTQAVRDCHIGGRELFEAEAKALLNWGQDWGLILGLKGLTELRPVSSGAEHEVFFDAAKQKAIKLTREGAYGHSVVAGPGKSALPLEYLQRWMLQNSLFGDSAEMIGLIPGETCPRVLVSQTWITAHPTSPVPEHKRSMPIFGTWVLRISGIKTAPFIIAKNWTSWFWMRLRIISFGMNRGILFQSMSCRESRPD